MPRRYKQKSRKSRRPHSSKAEQWNEEALSGKYNMQARCFSKLRDYSCHPPSVVDSLQDSTSLPSSVCNDFIQNLLSEVPDPEHPCGTTLDNTTEDTIPKSDEIRSLQISSLNDCAEVQSDGGNIMNVSSQIILEQQDTRSSIQSELLRPVHTPANKDVKVWGGPSRSGQIDGKRFTKEPLKGPLTTDCPDISNISQAHFHLLDPSQLSMGNINHTETKHPRGGSFKTSERDLADEALNESQLAYKALLARPSNQHKCSPTSNSRIRLGLHRAAEIMGAKSTSVGKNDQRRVIIWLERQSPILPSLVDFHQKLICALAKIFHPPGGISKTTSVAEGDTSTFSSTFHAHVSETLLNNRPRISNVIPRKDGNKPTVSLEDRGSSIQVDEQVDTHPDFNYDNALDAINSTSVGLDDMKNAIIDKLHAITKLEEDPLCYQSKVCPTKEGVHHEFGSSASFKDSPRDHDPHVDQVDVSLDQQKYCFGGWSTTRTELKFQKKSSNSRRETTEHPVESPLVRVLPLIMFKNESNTDRFIRSGVESVFENSNIDLEFERVFPESSGTEIGSTLSQTHRKRSRNCKRKGNSGGVADKRGGLVNEEQPSSITLNARKLEMTNKGFELLQRLGWKKDEGLGVNNDGCRDPLSHSRRQARRCGIGL